MKFRQSGRFAFAVALGLLVGLLPPTEVVAREGHAKKARAVAYRKSDSSQDADAKSTVRVRTKRRTRQARAKVVVPARPSIGQVIGLHRVTDPLELRSSVAFVLDARTQEPVYEKNADAVLPIASITKLLTAMVVIDAELPMDEIIQIDRADIDVEKHSASRLRPGMKLSRGELLQLALMASENRAASALGRSYPGGLPAFVVAMNRKARAIGMRDASFSDPTGLSSANVANARDLSQLVLAAHGYPLLRRYSTASDLTVDTGRRQLRFHNTNRLVDNEDWRIDLQKTGYITEAGRCLVMQVELGRRPFVMVLLDSAGKYSRYGDAGRLRRYIEFGATRQSAQDGGSVGAAQARAS